MTHFWAWYGAVLVSIGAGELWRRWTIRYRKAQRKADYWRPILMRLESGQ